MYKSFYGLETSPFQISTDPTFLWLGEKHREAISMLKYGIQVDDHTGMVLLTGDTGTGKTTLINALFKSLDRTVIRAAVKNPSMGNIDFFNYIAASFGNTTLFTTKSRFLLAFEQFLNNAAAKKRKVLLVIDEAQVLTDALLNEIRLLANFEKDGQSLIHIFLVGQQELREHLTRPVNKALAQRITLNYHIEPLIPEETREYIQYRLQVAGTSKPLFSNEAVQQVHRFSRGLPRQINILCDHALLTGYVKNLEQISGEVIDECARELAISRFPEPHMNHRVTDGSSDHKDPGPEPVFESESTPVPPVSRTQPAAKAILNKDRADLTEDPSPEPAKPFRLTYLLIIAVAVLISVAAAGLFFL
jgi:general secretion pathway protein A